MDFAERLHKLFAGRADAHGTHGLPVKEGLKWAIKTTARTVHEPVTVDRWRDHVAGVRPLGVIPIDADSLCYFGSIDYDEYDVDVTEVIARVEDAKMPLVPVSSKSGGLHLFLFLEEPVPAAVVQTALRNMAARLGLAGSEIFPKQRTVIAQHGDVGNWMVMPYFGSTYGGRIKEQVGLTRSGGKLPLDAFLVTAEAARVSARVVERMASARRSTTQQQTEDAPTHADGPPCLEHLVGTKIQHGHQSNFLFHLGVFYKRAFPGDWKPRLEEAGRTMLDPPSTAEGLQSVVKSLSKKDYDYTCKNQPMAAYCNSTLCRARRFGVGQSELPTVAGLSKLDSDPPLWFVDIEGERLHLDTEHLMTYLLFHRACADKLNKCYSTMKQSDWLKLLKPAFENLIVIPASKDASFSDQFLEILDNFLTNQARGKRLEDILAKKPWENEEDKAHWFRIMDLMSFLAREGFTRWTRAQVITKIKDLGGGHFNKKIKGKFTNLWRVPVGYRDEPEAAKERLEA